MPSQSKPRAPQTPAPGSSPIRPPSGSARKTPTAQRRSAPARPNLPTPPVNPPSPAVQRMMQRKLQQLAAQQQPPAIRPPGLAAPAQQQRPAPPPMQSRPGPTPITPSQPQSTFSQATTSPWGAGLMNGPAPDDGTQTGFARDIAYPVVKRLAQAWDTVTAPTYQETPAPTMQDLGATGVAGAGSPAVRGIRQNEDGSEDWVIAGAAGQNDYTPKTRTVAPNPLQMLSRSVTQGAMMGLEAWGVPAKIVERGLGTVTANTAQLTKPVNLPDGTVYTPPTRDTATPSTVQLGAATGPRYVFPDNTLAATDRKSVV